jgi:hypothetical protein
MLLQVLALTREQVDMLPADQKAQIVQLVRIAGYGEGTADFAAETAILRCGRLRVYQRVEHCS